MNVSPKSRFPHYAFAAVFGLGLLSAPAAQAFTIDDQSGGNSSGGSARYADPDARRFGSGTNDGPNTIRQGNTTLQFGAQRPLDYQSHKEQMFVPNGRPAGER